MSLPKDTSAPLSPARVTRLQQIIGTFLYYARALDCTMLHKVNQLGSRQANPTEDVEAQAEHFMQYAATWPDASVAYHASDMILHAQSDGSYLSESNARSRAAGFCFFGEKQNTNGTPSLINGALSVFSTIPKLVVCSAAEIEYAALFLMGRELHVIRSTCEDMGFPQPATEIQTDNACAAGIANDSITQKHSKAMDMRFHWIRDQVREKHLTVTWRPGTDNLADFFTKNHSPAHHRAMRQFFVQDARVQDPEQNCRTRRVHKRAASGPNR
jgi:hypothetical protein